MSTHSNQNAWTSWLALAAAIGLAGCGGGGGGGGYGGGGGGTPSVSLTTVSLDFGPIPIGVASMAQTVQVNNIGTGTLTVSSVTVTGSNAASFSGTTQCASVAAGASCTVSVTFTPPSAGAATATLNIASDAAGSPATVTLSGTGEASGANTVAVVVNNGPDPGSNPTINVLYTTVTVCKPGTQICQTIDHIQVDTGSYGLRILNEALGHGLISSDLPTAMTTIGNALVECTQFADGYSWGTVKTADMTIGAESAAGIRIQVIGDPTYPDTLAPGACTSPNPNKENTIAVFGANGIIGIGYFLEDCGASCPSDGSIYNDCTPTACTGYGAPLVEQVANPVGKFAADNNGVIIQLAAVPTTGATSAAGTLVFGIGTQPNNGVPNTATVYDVNPGNGLFTATYQNTALTASFIDSGSNGYYFPNLGTPALPACPAPNPKFYCPVPDASLSATIKGFGGNSGFVDFTVGDLNSLSSTTAAASGVAGLPGTLTDAFDFGLTFFYGRSVYVTFEGPLGQPAPSIAF